MRRRGRGEVAWSGAGIPGLVVGLGLGLAGCGSRAPGDGPGASEGRPAPEVVVAEAGGPVDAEAAEAGKALFQAKGCSACHAFGARLTGPDLAGVTERRSRAWLTRMIQHPDEMTRDDAAARELLATHLVQMPVLGLDGEQARQIIEYFRTMEAQAPEAPHREED